MGPRPVTELSGDELVEGIGHVRALLLRRDGTVAERLAVHPQDWPIIERKLDQFCEDNLVPGFFVPNRVGAVLCMAIYVTDDIPQGTVNVGPWMPHELARRRPG